MWRAITSWLVALWREERLLALLLGALVLRLILYHDGHFTIRDTDFYPADYLLQRELLFRGGRVIPLLFSHLWEALSAGSPFLAKKIAGVVILLLASPGFVLMSLRAGLRVRATGFAAALFLANAQLFGIYDTLGPYFLLMALFPWQVLFALDSRDGRPGAFLRFCVVTVIALLCHRNALMSTGITLGVVFLGQGARRIRLRELAVFAGLLVIIAWKVLLSMRFDAIERDHQLLVYGSGLFRSIGWRPLFAGPAMARGVLSLIPGWAGVMWPVVPYMAAMTALFLGLLVAGAARIRLALRWAALFALGGAVVMALLTEAMTTDLFFRPNHATYGSIWVPLFVLLIGVFLADGLPRWLGGALLVLLIAVNLWSGHGFRTEAFDFRAYEAFVAEEIREHPGPRRLVPAFLANEYALRFPVGRELRPFVRDETLHNDFTTFRARRFHIDFIIYDELGLPLFRYAEYRRHFEEWAAATGREVSCREFPTFTSCSTRLMQHGRR